MLRRRHTRRTDDPRLVRLLQPAGRDAPDGSSPPARDAGGAPAAAQVPADRPTGTGDRRAPTGVAPDALRGEPRALRGRRVVAIDITGHNVTKDWVIAREIRTKVGEPLDHRRGGARRRIASTTCRSSRRSGWTAEPVGDDGVRLVFNFKEMPSWFPILSYVYTEENGLSWGLGVSAGNLTAAGPLGVGPRLLRRSRAAVDPDLLALDQRQPPVLRLLRRPATRSRTTLRGFEETSYEFTPEVGTWIGDHGWARAQVLVLPDEERHGRHHR